MYPLNDKDLDRLSRDAAEQFDVEPSASGWEQLEQRLNKELPVANERDRRRFIFWVFIAALLSGGGLLGMLMTNNKPGTIGKTIVKTSTPTTAIQPTTTSPDKKANTTGQQTITASTPANKAVATKDKPAVQKQLSTGNEPAVQKAGNGLIVKKAKERTEKPRPNKRQRTATNDQVVVTPIPDIATGNNSNDKQKKPAGKTNEPVVPVTDPTNSVADKAVADKINDPATKESVKKNVAAQPAAPLTNETARKEDSKKPVAEKEPAKKQPTVKLKQPLELGITAGPDFTSVNFRQTNKTGINAGLTLGYRFNDRWSVNTGFLYTKKNYTAVGEDFTAPKHSWISYVDLHKVKGNCSMWEIPLNVRYDFAERFNNRFFVSTGLSNYLMNHEYYDYYYRYQGNEAKQAWETDSARHYMFSVLNFSIGYEHALSREFSIQAEPYLKVPLKGLGVGSMNMDSYGIYFTLKYKPVWGRKK